MALTACGCGCGRLWTPLNKLRRYHPECDGVPLPVARVKRAYTRHIPEDPAMIEALFQAARAARRLQVAR